MYITKRSIVGRLINKYNIQSINSVQKLNKLLVEMGLQVKNCQFWQATRKGLEYSAFHIDALNPDLWNEKIVKAIVKYISK